jgi:uncharacterized protein
VHAHDCGVELVLRDGHRASLRRRGVRLPQRPGAGPARQPTAAEHEVLGAIPYQPNLAVLHTDERVLPRRRKAWAAWNYHIPAERRRRRSQ